MPPGPTPPGPDGKRSSWRRAAIVAGVVVALTGAVIAFGIFATRDRDDRTARPRAKPTPPGWSREAARRLTTLPGLRYAGTLSLGGRQVQVRLTVTRTGLGTGTLTDGTISADLVAVDGATYVKGGTAFWQTYSGEAARSGSFAGRWTKAPPALSALADVKDALSPKGIASSLKSPEGPPSSRNVGTTPAYLVKTSKADYLVASSAPYKLLRVQSEGQGRPRFAVTPLADLASAFSEIRTRVAALGGAADPALRFQPGRPKFVNCNDNITSCTLSVDATLTSPEGSVPAGARAMMRATITAEGRTLGRCTGSEAVPSDRSLELRCKVTSSVWRAWVREVRDAPGTHPYEGHARVIGEAVAASDVDRLLGLVGEERSDLGKSRSPSPSSTP